jgi:hypothetical protein
MKKFISCIFAFALIFSLYGCTGSSSASKGMDLGNGRIGML